MSILSALTFDSKKIKPAGLMRLNLAVAVVELILLVSVLVIGLASHTSLPVVSGYAVHNALNPELTSQTSVASASRHLFDINLVYPLAALFLITSVGHALSATRSKAAYEGSLKSEINRQRMYILAPGVGIAAAVVGMLAGVADLALLLTLLGLGSLISYLVLNYERLKTAARTLAPSASVFAVLPVAAIGVIYAIYLYAGYVFGQNMPTYAPVTAVVFFVYLLLFVRQTAGYSKAKKEYSNIERYSLLLTLIFEIILALVGIFYVF